MGKRAATTEEVGTAALGLAVQRLQEAQARGPGSSEDAPVVVLLLGHDDEVADFEIVSHRAATDADWAVVMDSAWTLRPEFAVYVCELELTEDDGSTWRGVAVAVYGADGIGEGRPFFVVGLDKRAEVDRAKPIDESHVRWLPPDSMPFLVPLWPSARRNLRHLAAEELESAIEEFLVGTAEGAEAMKRDVPVTFGIGLGKRLERPGVKVAWFAATTEAATTFPCPGTFEETRRLFALGAERVMIVSRSVALDGTGSTEATLALVRAAVSAGAGPEDIAKLEGVRTLPHDSVMVGCLAPSTDGSAFAVERAWSLAMLDGAEWQLVERLDVTAGKSAAVELNA